MSEGRKVFKYILFYFISTATLHVLYLVSRKKHADNPFYEDTDLGMYYVSIVCVS